ncbi:ATPase P [Opitutaceae bacterium TAV5]|nr:ATPase P [Opitutaceae bacterium TAV5]
MSDDAATLASPGGIEPGLQADQRLVDRAWLRIGIGLAVTGQAMVFSLGVNITAAEGAGYWVVHGGLMASALLVLVFLGGDLAGSAWAAIRERRVSVDLLFLVTLLGALGGSLVSTLTRTGPVYYEVVAILVVVHTTGKMLGARSRVAALAGVEAMRRRYDRCRVLGGDGTVRDIAVRDVTAEDRVVVEPGDEICVDGEILVGCGYVEETALTGEWRPVSRGPGERVMAGTRSVDGRLVIRPGGEGDGREGEGESGGGGNRGVGRRKIDAIFDAVAQARLAPSRWQRQADRLMAWFLPLVVSVSLGTFVVWWWILEAGWDRALFNAMAVLLVACPCAMGLATPVAVWGGLARLASFGVVARSGDFLDALARVDTVCFDKTGTLSESRVSVLEWRFADAWSEEERRAWLRAAVAAAERRVEHPVARALAEAGGAPTGGVRVSRVTPVPGRGLVAEVVSADGAGARTRELRIGERSLGGADASADDDGSDPAGKRIHVFVDGLHAACVTLGETWREGLTATLAALREAGVIVEVLTGDPHPPPDLQAAGVTVRGGLSPEEKVARVQALRAEGRTVLFAGDGVNDAAAMSAAQASIAMGGGSELARVSAMAVFAGDELRWLPDAMRMARAVAGGVRGNLLFAASYNIIGMALAAGGVLHPVVAALLMVVSSVWVSGRALRSSRSRERSSGAEGQKSKTAVDPDSQGL